MNQIELSFEARDKGIKRAVDHSDRVHDQWSDRAYDLLLTYLQVIGSRPFQCEDFRSAISETIAEPPSKRAFGHIILKAAKEGLITRVGYAPVKNVTAHRAFASVWKSCK